jgi:hypothetical protein
VSLRTPTHPAMLGIATLSPTYNIGVSCIADKGAKNGGREGASDAQHRRRRAAMPRRLRRTGVRAGCKCVPGRVRRNFGRRDRVRRPHLGRPRRHGRAFIAAHVADVYVFGPAETTNCDAISRDGHDPPLGWSRSRRDRPHLFGNAGSRPGRYAAFTRSRAALRPNAATRPFSTSRSFSRSDTKEKP